MRDRPAQFDYRHFAVHALEHVEQLADGSVAVPVLRQRHAALGRPLRGLVERFLVGLGRLVFVVHAEGDALADAVEPQHIVAKAHRQELCELLEFVELLAALLRKIAVVHAHGQRLLAPHAEQRRVFRGRHVEAARIDDAGKADAVELAEELARALDLLLEGRRGQLVEQRDDAPGDCAGRIAARIAHELRARRQVGFRVEA